MPSHPHLFGMLPFVLGGCTPESELRADVAGEMPTVAEFSWAGVEEDVLVRVEETAGGSVLRTEATATAEATVLGMKPSTEYRADLVNARNETVATTTFQTGALEAVLPSWQTTGTAGWNGYLYLGCFNYNGTPMVVDTAGNVVWARTEPNRNVLRVRPNADATAVTYASILGLSDDDVAADIVTVSWSGEELSRIYLEHFSHDFLFLDDGTLAYIRTDRRSVEGIEGTVDGDQIVELSPEGSERVVWSTFDHWDPLTDGNVGDGGEWTHANALDYDPSENVYDIGFYGMDAIVRVDRDAGQTVWQLGGSDSDFAFDNPDDRTKNQHQFQFVEGGVVIFDNQTAQSGSRAIELSLDEEEMTASKAWSWQPANARWSEVLGDVDRGDDGSTLITWSAAGVIDDVAADGSLRWSLSLRMGQIFGFTHREPRLPGMQAPE